MLLETLTPAQQVAALTRRIYERRLTTASGGNLSIREAQGDILITPARIDKGRLRAEDVVRVAPTGQVIGQHRPSTELPFHQAIYAARPDLAAVAHAHCPSLVAYSLVHQRPLIEAIAPGYAVCGPVGYAPYAVTASPALGQAIAAEFARGCNVVIMENHGAVAGGPDLLSAYQRLETLEFCAQALLRAAALGPVTGLTAAQLDQFMRRGQSWPVAKGGPALPSDSEMTLRLELTAFLQRGCVQGVFSSSQGTLSARIDARSFIITPAAVDRQAITAEQLVLIRGDSQPAGQTPDPDAGLHARLYADHPQIRAIIAAQPPNALAFALTERAFEHRTIAESYITLKTIARAPWDWQINDPGRVSALLAGDTPVALLENNAVLTAGQTLTAAFDRLEVAEFSARAVIDALGLGTLTRLSDAQLAELDQLHFPEMGGAPKNV